MAESKLDHDGSPLYDIFGMAKYSSMGDDGVSIVQVASVLSRSGDRIFDNEAWGDCLSDRAVAGSVVEKEFRMAVRVSANWTGADGLSTNRVVLLAVDHKKVISTSSSEAYT